MRKACQLYCNASSLFSGFCGSNLFIISNGGPATNVDCRSFVERFSAHATPQEPPRSPVSHTSCRLTSLLCQLSRNSQKKLCKSSEGHSCGNELVADLATHSLHTRLVAVPMRLMHDFSVDTMTMPAFS